MGAIGAIVACMLPATASAETQTLRSPEAVARDCAVALPAGTPGVATSSWTARAGGLLTARLNGPAGSDWDLALVRNGVPVGSSGSFGSIEQASIGVLEQIQRKLGRGRAAGSVRERRRAGA